MKIKYQDGGVNDLLKRLEMTRTVNSINNSSEPNRDPIARRLEAERFASDRRNLMENAYDTGVLPDPRETGAVTPGPSYILEAALLGAPLGRIGAGAKTAGKVIKRGGIPEIDALRAKDLAKFSESMANKRNLSMLNDQQKRMAEDRLQYMLDRIRNEAATEDLADGLNLQAHLTDILNEAIAGDRARAEEILRNIGLNKDLQRSIMDSVDEFAGLITGKSGGVSSARTASGELVEGKDVANYMGMDDASMKKYLANPGAFSGQAGYPRLPFDITKPASRNEFGGKITVVK